MMLFCTHVGKMMLAEPTNHILILVCIDIKLVDLYTVKYSINIYVLTVIADITTRLVSYIQKFREGAEIVCSHVRLSTHDQLTQSLVDKLG